VYFDQRYVATSVIKEGNIKIWDLENIINNKRNCVNLNIKKTYKWCMVYWNFIWLQILIFASSSDETIII